MSGARSTNVRGENASVIKHKGKESNLVDLDIDVSIMFQLWKFTP